jgi:hypothetical protein
MHHISHEAVCRVRDRGFWTNGEVVTHDHYNLWTTQGGRLQQIRSGVIADSDSLQDLRYTCDAVGNVRTILDTLTAGFTRP